MYLIDYIAYGLHLWYIIYFFKEICRKPIPLHPGLGSTLFCGPKARGRREDAEIRPWQFAVLLWTLRTAGDAEERRQFLRPAIVNINFVNILHIFSGLFIHTFEIKSNLILFSNPIMAYAYQKQRKT